MRRLLKDEVRECYTKIGATPKQGISSDKDNCCCALEAFGKANDLNIVDGTLVKLFGQSYFGGFIDGFDNVCWNPCMVFSINKEEYLQGVWDGAEAMLEMGLY